MSGRSALRIGDVEAIELARRFGTPLYAYDAAEIRARYHAFGAAISYRPLSLYYSIKAHPSVGLLKLLRTLGAGVDACSPGDLAFAAAAGFSGPEISYAGHGMSHEEIAGVVRSGSFFVADSLSQVERIGMQDPGRAIALRVNCGVGAGFHPDVQAGSAGSKFGLPLDQLDEALTLAAGANLRVVGLHTHVGSDVLEPEPHIDALTALVELVSEREALTRDLELLDLGGGWGSPFLAEDPEYPMAEFGAAASHIMSQLADALGRPIELRLEPGAYLVMDAGTLLTTVTELKPKGEGVEGRARTFAATDTSYNHIRSAVTYGTRHPLEVADRPDAPDVERYDVTGNLMQAGDVIARDRLLPALQPGDVLAFGMCGGYKACQAPTFNERPRPAEVLVDEGEVLPLRVRETEADLLRGQGDPWSYTYAGAVKVAETPLSSDFGRFRMLAFEFPSGSEHLALVVGDPASSAEPPLVRVQSSCITGTTLHSRLCDCRQQLEMAMELVASASGIVLYLDQEGRSHGLVEKVEQLRLIAGGLDTVEAAEARGRTTDRRRYGEAAWILQRLLGDTPIRALTNSPDKVGALRAEGVAITERVAIQPDPTPGNAEYLRVKRTKMGHLLDG